MLLWSALAGLSALALASRSAPDISVSAWFMPSNEVPRSPAYDEMSPTRRPYSWPESLAHELPSFARSACNAEASASTVCCMARQPAATWSSWLGSPAISARYSSSWLMPAYRA